MIKKLFLALFGVIGIFTISQTFAAEQETNILDALGGNAEWAASIVLTWTTATSVNIEFPVFVTNGEQIQNYAVSYVKWKSIIGADLTDMKKSVFEGDKIKIENDKVTLVFDGLEAETRYFFVVVPINKEGSELEPSDERDFTTLSAAEAAAIMNPPTTTEWGENPTDPTMQWAANTESANFTYKLNNNRVTVSWKAISWATKFSFSSKEATQSTYTDLGDELISKQTFSFVINKKWMHTLKIVPIDDAWAVMGVEKTLSIKIDTVVAPDGKWTPATGTWLNLILMSTFLMMLMYVVYRFRNTR
jgi:hypothetical protein